MPLGQQIFRDQIHDYPIDQFANIASPKHKCCPVGFLFTERRNYIENLVLCFVTFTGFAINPLPILGINVAFPVIWRYPLIISSGLVPYTQIVVYLVARIQSVT
jgi:hypothetical protein